MSEVYQTMVGKTSDERTGAADMMHETYRLEKFIRRKGVVMRIAWERP